MKHGLKLMMKERFRDYFQRVRDTGRQLLGRMQAFEVCNLILSNDWFIFSYSLVIFIDVPGV